MAKIVEPGEIVDGRWRVESELGEGGAGYVVRATDLEKSEEVALKFLLPSAAKDPELVQRFHREASAAAMLHSAPAIRIFEVRDLAQGRHVMAMELLSGKDLGQIIETDGKMSVERAVDLLLEATEAVAEAHSLGIVHRDLKPANLFLCQSADGDNRMKVLDFGISKVKSASARLTRTASVLGSPEYMPPEQLQGAKYVDARCDIWALGVILYELVTGSLPFNGKSEAMLTVQIVTGKPDPLATYSQDLPSGLQDVIFRCLEKNPADRYQSVADLADALAPFGSPKAIVFAAKIRDRLPEPPPYSQHFSIADANVAKPNIPKPGAVPAFESAKPPAQPLEEKKHVGPLPNPPVPKATPENMAGPLPQKKGPPMGLIAAVVVVLLAIVGFVATR